MHHHINTVAKKKQGGNPKYVQIELPQLPIEYVHKPQAIFDLNRMGGFWTNKMIKLKIICKD